MSAHRAPSEPLPLSLLLRAGTSASHRLAEEAPFVRSLLSGRVAPRVYARFLEGLYFVYAELEGALDRHRSHPVVSLLDVPGLRRLPSLEDDLRWWSGPSWRCSASPSPATCAYADRIRHLAEGSVVLLVGHLYTRYLGDLSGGQIIGRALERAFSLSDGAGVAFYRFRDRARAKERFRSQLDVLPVDRATSELIVAEACKAFDHNMQLFDELAPLEP